MSTKPIKRCYIDVETGGLNDWKNPVVQIAGIIEIDGERKEDFNLNARPFSDQQVTDKSLETTGLTMAEINKFPPPNEAYKTLTKLLGSHVDQYDRSDKFFFVGYNSTFDQGFMRNFWKRNNDKYFGSLFFFPTVDVMVIAGEHLRHQRGQMKNFKLTTVAQHILGDDLDISDAHDAMWDIEITRRIYQEIQPSPAKVRQDEGFGTGTF